MTASKAASGTAMVDMSSMSQVLASNPCSLPIIRAQLAILFAVTAVWQSASKLEKDARMR